jgi:hypothetical protein
LFFDNFSVSLVNSPTWATCATGQTYFKDNDVYLLDCTIEPGRDRRPLGTLCGGDGLARLLEATGANLAEVIRNPFDELG